MPRSRDNVEGRTQSNPKRHHRSTGAAAMVVLSILTIGCGAQNSTDNQPTATVDTGHSADRDSLINATTSTQGYSADHDSRINDDPSSRENSAGDQPSAFPAGREWTLAPTATSAHGSGDDPWRRI